MAKIKLFVFDFDGTALGGYKPYARFPDPFARFLDRLDEQGIRWATNTGRSLEDQEQIIRRSKLRSSPAILIAQSGMRIGWLRAGRLVQDRQHQKQAEAAERRFRKRIWPCVRGVFIGLLHDNLVERISFDDTSIISLSCRKFCESQTRRHLKPLLDSGDYYSLNPVQATDALLFPSCLDKGRALQKVRRRLRIRSEETIVAGDEINDIHLFNPAVARWMVCPANANPAIKEAVRRFGGIVARRSYSRGVMEGTQRILTSLRERTGCGVSEKRGC